jgi:hypothetical protein
MPCHRNVSFKQNFESVVLRIKNHQSFASFKIYLKGNSPKILPLHSHNKERPITSCKGDYLRSLHLISSYALYFKMKNFQYILFMNSIDYKIFILLLSFVLHYFTIQERNYVERAIKEIKFELFFLENII